MASKRLEDNPSYPSFGPRTQEHGKVLYNEVSSKIQNFPEVRLTCAIGHLRRVQRLRGQRRSSALPIRLWSLIHQLRIFFPRALVS